MEYLRNKYPNSEVHIEYVNQPVLPEPPEHFSYHAPYGITPTKTPGVGPFQGILRQHWHMSRVYKFAKENGVSSDSIFVRCRPDLHYHKLVIPESVPNAVVFAPWWGNYGPGLNDRFGIMGARAAEAYFQTYDNLSAMLAEGCPFHPETLVGYSVERAGNHIIRSLGAEFGFVRTNGEFVGVTPIQGEIAEYAALLSNDRRTHSRVRAT